MSTEAFFTEEPITWLQDLLGEFGLDVALAVTYLGDIAAYIVILSLVYWFWEHERGATLIALALLALSSGLFIKEVVAMSRPPAELWVTEELGPGLPSVHALSAVVVYGTMARYLPVGTQQIRVVSAIGIVLAVAVSRVALGVHYIGDVIAGLVIGVLILGLFLRFYNGRTTSLFLVAVVLAGGAAFLSGGEYYPMALTAGSVGALAGWMLASDRSVSYPAPIVSVPLVLLAGLHLVPGSSGNPMVLVIAANFAIGIIVLGFPQAVSLYYRFSPRVLVPNRHE